ncbi:MAG: RNA polymerase sigma factor [Acidobacteria bacterium]|nr:RNA polymerase sigma factor [Acidobacteriota bacterium]
MSTTGVSDSELVERARRGDHAAFGVLVDRHRTAAFRTALAALGSAEDAEEVTQEAFVAAFRALPGFREQASFKTWLLSIAWRKALTRRRSVKALLRRFVAPAEGAQWDFPDASRGQERALIDAELGAHLTRLISRLSPKLRDVLLLTTSGEHTYDEVAGMLGIPLGTVKWRMAESRRQLKVKLAALGYGHV